MRLSIIALSISALFGFFMLQSCDRENSQKEERKQFAKISEDKDTPELAEHMRDLQDYTHKLALSIKAENPELADFYMHELTAKKDVIKKDIPGYEGYDIAYFMGFMLDPTVDSLDASLDSRDWDAVRSDFEVMVQSCNSCHNATSHGFIRITQGFDKNPFNQSFERR